EYEWTPGGDLLVTLLRAVGQLSRGDLPTRPGHAGWPTPTPGAQCLGPDRIELALVPVTAGGVERGDRLPELGEDGFLPVRGRRRRTSGSSATATASSPHGSSNALSRSRTARGWSLPPKVYLGSTWGVESAATSRSARRG